MKGAIVINGFIGVGEHQAKRLREEFLKLGLDVPVIRNKLGAVPDDLDFCVFLDKDIYTARSLEKKGVRLFNFAEAIEVCDDKMLTYVALEKVVRQPYTLSSSFCYFADAPVSEEELDRIERELDFPLILKINKHSRGEGVFLVKDREELKEYITRFRATPHIYQKYISFAKGRDIRVIVIGGEPVCAMERFNPCDYRSNVELGGVGSPVAICDQIKEMAIRVSKTLNLDYCGIDFLTDEKGLNYVCEVNSNAFFKGVEAVCGVNVAGLYAKHILEVLQ